ncbi:MAG: DUF2795 domain-containing protein [Sphingomonadaceae bacterium]
MAQTLTRDELRTYLRKVGWPESLPALVDWAKQQGAPQSVVEILERVPNRVYTSEGDLWGEVQRQLKPVETR